MNSNRKADLQRRLSMASMPKPPAGLADRIKQDIPQYLGTQPERERLSKSIAFNLRVAASILLMVSSVYLCLHILSRTSTTRLEMNGARARVASVPVSVSNAAPPEIRQPVIAPNMPPRMAPHDAAANIVTPATIAAERLVLHRELADAQTRNENGRVDEEVRAKQDDKLRDRRYLNYADVTGPATPSRQAVVLPEPPPVMAP